ncbi:MAG: hypothetical protein M5U19_10985 [Microthrixaceae bacterium]|nr:hypothetical protein [Microthrixaceae bacterium]
MDAVDLPRVVDAEMVTWSGHPGPGVLDAVAGDWLYVMWVLFLTTGVRCGSWPDFPDGTTSTSTGRPWRSCATGSRPGAEGGEHPPAEDSTWASQRRTRRDLGRGAAGTPTAELEERMRFGRAGRLRLRVLRRRWRCAVSRHDHRDFKSIIRKLDVPQIRLHDMRHTSATLALKAGIHPKVVSERLGHAMVSITLDSTATSSTACRLKLEQIGAVVFGGSDQALSNEQHPAAHRPSPWCPSLSVAAATLPSPE